MLLFSVALDNELTARVRRQFRKQIPVIKCIQVIFNREEDEQTTTATPTPTIERRQGSRQFAVSSQGVTACGVARVFLFWFNPEPIQLHRFLAYFGEPHWWFRRTIVLFTVLLGCLHCLVCALCQLFE